VRGRGLFPSLLSSIEMTGGTTNLTLRRESQGSLNSSASLDLGFLAFVSSKSEVS
jgi:regulator of G-protein signaling 14